MACSRAWADAAHAAPLSALRQARGALLHPALGGLRHLGTRAWLLLSQIV